MKYIEKELKRMWRKEILTGFKKFVKPLCLSTFLVILSCATQKELNGNANLVHLQINTRKSYCGGAAPDSAMQVPVISPRVNYSLKLFLENEDGSRGKELKTIVTDDTGGVTVRLPNGKYQLWLPSKSLSLNEFIEKESPDKGADFEYKDNECFLAWKESADFVFEIKSDTSLAFRYEVDCYTGVHPCLKYTGVFHH